MLLFTLPVLSLWVDSGSFIASIILGLLNVVTIYVSRKGIHNHFLLKDHTALYMWTLLLIRHFYGLIFITIFA